MKNRYGLFFLVFFATKSNSMQMSLKDINKELKEDIILHSLIKLSLSDILQKLFELSLINKEFNELIQQNYLIEKIAYSYIINRTLKQQKVDILYIIKSYNINFLDYIFSFFKVPKKSNPDLDKILNKFENNKLIRPLLSNNKFLKLIAKQYFFNKKELVKKSIEKVNPYLPVNELTNSIKLNNLYAVKSILLNKLDIDSQDEFGNTALIEAVIHNNKPMVQFLLQSGANINLNYILQDTALMKAVGHNYEDITELLLNNNANPNLMGRHNCTALIYAIDNNNETITKWLLDKNANINAPDLCGTTSLMRAAARGYINLVKLLIIYNADVNAQNIHGSTALIFASQYNTHNHLKIVKLLLKTQANIDIENCYKERALQNAIYNNNIEMTKLFLNKKAQFTKIMIENLVNYIEVYQNNTPIYQDMFKLLITSYKKPETIQEIEIFDLLKKGDQLCSNTLS